MIEWCSRAGTKPCPSSSVYPSVLKKCHTGVLQRGGQLISSYREANTIGCWHCLEKVIAKRWQPAQRHSKKGSEVRIPETSLGKHYPLCMDAKPRQSKGLQRSLGHSIPYQELDNSFVRSTWMHLLNSETGRCAHWGDGSVGQVLGAHKRGPKLTSPEPT